MVGQGKPFWNMLVSAVLAVPSLKQYCALAGTGTTCAGCG